MYDVKLTINTVTIIPFKFRKSYHSFPSNSGYILTNHFNFKSLYLKDSRQNDVNNMAKSENHSLCPPTNKSNLAAIHGQMCLSGSCGIQVGVCETQCSLQRAEPFGEDRPSPRRRTRRPPWVPSLGQKQLGATPEDSPQPHLDLVLS